MSAALTEKLHALAQRRCAHLVELQRSGRWTRYYSQDEFLARMEDAARVAQQWQHLSDAGNAVAAADTETKAAEAAAICVASERAAVVLVASPPDRPLVAMENALLSGG